jgi:hypothetical protein
MTRVTGRVRIVVLSGIALAGLLLVGLGVLFAVMGLTRADQLASVIGAFATLIGLGTSVYGIVLARRGAQSPAAGQQIGAQSVSGSTVGGGVTQIHGVRGNLRVRSGADPAVRTRAATPSAAAGPASAGQSVEGSQISGSVHQIRDIGGNAELEP